MVVSAQDECSFGALGLRRPQPEYRPYPTETSVKVGIIGKIEQACLNCALCAEQLDSAIAVRSQMMGR